MLDKRFIIVGGKGGVGRTTVAAALATVLARQGKRVLLTHVRTRQRLGRLFGCEEIHEKIRRVEPNLWAVNMTPEAALREKGLMVLRFKAVYRAVMENRLVRYFLRAIPSLSEYAMLGKAWYHTTEMEGGEPKYDTVIFDGPAMGHLITMLRIPQVITEIVPEGPLTADARLARDLLTDPARTCLWIVTLAEEMPVREAMELYDLALDDLHIAPDRLVVNALYPDDFEREPRWSALLDQLVHSEREQEGLPPLASAITWRSRRRINRQYLDLLEDRIALPRIELPHLFVEEMTRPSLDRLATYMEESLKII